MVYSSDNKNKSLNNDDLSPKPKDKTQNNPKEDLEKLLKDMDIEEPKENTHIDLEIDLDENTYIDLEGDLDENMYIDLESNLDKAIDDNTFDNNQPNINNSKVSLDKDDYIDNNKKNTDYNDNEKENKSFFNKIKSLFKTEEELVKEEKLSDYSYEYSKFREYIFLLDEREDDSDIIKAIDLCDGNLKLDRHRAYLSKKKKDYETIVEDLRCYELLSDKETQYFKNIVNNFLQLVLERRAISYQLDDFNSSINKLEALEKEAIDSIYQIEDAEKSKATLSNDIALIKDEKERTLLDREKLQFAYNIVYRFSFTIAILLGISITSLALVSIATDTNMFLPLSIICIILVFTIAAVYIFRRKIVFELKLNDKKQAKLVSLLNKKTVVYSYYVNFLNYTYKKYSIKSSRMLKSNIDDFHNYKLISGRYDKLSRLLAEAQKQLEDFIAKKDIIVSSPTLEGFAKSINIDNKISYAKDINTKIDKIDKRIAEVDTEHEKMWDKLVEINLSDTSNENVVEKIMKAYIMETQKVVLEVELDDDNDEYKED